MKLNNNQTESGSANAEDIKNFRPPEAGLTDEAKLREEAQLDTQDDEEYEYVSLSEASEGVVAKIMDIVKENALILLFLGVAIACFILSFIGEYLNSLFIAIAFGFVAVAVAYMLHLMWQEKKEAERKYKHAKEVIEPVKQTMLEQTEDEY